MKVPIILDTDAGTDIDDLYALAFALRHPVFELLGVTTVYGDTQARARLVNKMLRLAGETRIPVAAGIQAPESQVARGEISTDLTDRLTHTQFVTKSDPEFHQTFPDAIEFTLNQLNKALEPIGLVGIGPWSNLAEILRQATPAQKKNIKFLALMGGEVHQMRTEHNVRCDPESAELVLNCGLPVFLSPFTICRQIFFTFDEIEILFRDSIESFVQALLKMTFMWRPFCHGRTGPVLFDVVPLFWITNPETILTRPGEVHVELTGQRTYGFTVADFSKTSGPVQVCVELDWSQIKEILRYYFTAV